MFFVFTFRWIVVWWCCTNSFVVPLRTPPSLGSTTNWVRTPSTPIPKQSLVDVLFLCKNIVLIVDFYTFESLTATLSYVWVILCLIRLIVITFIFYRQVQHFGWVPGSGLVLPEYCCCCICHCWQIHCCVGPCMSPSLCCWWDRWAPHHTHHLAPHPHLLILLWRQYS